MWRECSLRKDLSQEWSHSWSSQKGWKIVLLRDVNQSTQTDWSWNGWSQYNTTLKFLVQRNPAALWLMKTFNFPMEIAKRRAQSLRMKMRNAELYSCERSYSSLRFSTRLPKLASKLETLNYSHWFYSVYRENITARFKLIARWLSWAL